MTALPYSFARDHTLSLDIEQAVCIFAATTPAQALLEAMRCADRPIRFEKRPADAVLQHLEEAFGNSAREAVAEPEEDTLTALAHSAAEIDDLLDQKDDAPTVRLINALLLQAVKASASDIHIELEEKRLVVRFRIDGVLTEILAPNRAIAATLVSRIKVMGKLDIAEKRVPQDGRVSLRVGSYELDVRISTLPTQFGERVVLRLLDRTVTQRGIGHLGLSSQALSDLEAILQHANGLVLVTGPTGSGKTTTLYAALERLNDRSRNIMTVEDPIEYALDGIGQTQVNKQTDLTFARCLRAILRQDPDVILVGEIRDRETAHICVESAMTGHLVLSTLHTNSAMGAVTRMRNLGVEPYLLAPMVRGLISQRLVRRLCPSCKVSGPVTAAESDLSQGYLSVGTQIFQAVGCDACGGRGYLGREALYEVVRVDATLEEMIQRNASLAEMETHARRTTAGLFESGLEMVKSGEITLAEVLRVAGEMRQRDDTP